MPTSSDPRGEHPSTYVVQDSSNEEELIRLTIQDQLVTKSMGGVLPEQPDPTIFRRVLDVGCGPGGWLIATAQAYPSITQLIGVDVSARAVAYARKQAEEQQVSDRVEFHSMDALRMLEFPSYYFDLINQRSAVSFLRTWDWSKLLNEEKRVLCPGGTIRLTEPDVMPDSNSPALRRFIDLMLEAFHQSGHLYSTDRRSVSDNLPELLDRYGLQNVQTRDYTLEYRAGTPEGQLVFENTKLVLRTSLPFLRKWTRVPNDYEENCQRTLEEMQQPDFVMTWHIRTVWGNTFSTTPLSTRTR